MDGGTVSEYPFERTGRHASKIRIAIFELVTGGVTATFATGLVEVGGFEIVSVVAVAGVKRRHSYLSKTACKKSDRER